MTVRFLPRALDDLDAIRAWVGAENPDAADDLVDRLVDRALMLRTRLWLGRPRPELGQGVRQLLESPYLIFYEVRGEAAVILRVFHGARRITRRLLREG